MLEIKDKLIIEFKKDNEPVAYCEDGDIVVFHTVDCFNNMMKSEEDRYKLSEDDDNPSTGPLYINGLKAGDVLAVDVLDIEVDKRGVCCTMEDCGVLWSSHELRTKTFDIIDNKTTFNNVEFEIKPMIGVIGLAPENRSVNAMGSFELGGNMDCPLLNKGTTIYLPCKVDGGLLAIGDLHAIMGDGEIVGTGIEIAGKVTVKVRIIKNYKLNLPLLKTDDAYYINGYGIDAKQALTRAYKEMERLIAEKMNWDLTDAGMYLSLRGLQSANQSCLSDTDIEEYGPNFRVGVYKKEIDLKIK